MRSEVPKIKWKRFNIYLGWSGYSRNDKWDGWRFESRSNNFLDSSLSHARSSDREYEDKVEIIASSMRHSWRMLREVWLPRGEATRR